MNGMVNWLYALIIVGCLVLIAGVIIPVFVPMINGFTSGASETIDTGTPFMKVEMNLWFLFIVPLFLLAIYVTIKTRGGG